jgi:SAM-dependent methyltransferase
MLRRRIVLLAVLCAGMVITAWSASGAEKRTPDVIYVPTPQEAVTEMLRMTNVGKDDIVYDLGCGDGRIVITAVKEFGAKKGVGVDIDPQRIRESKENAEQAGVTDRVTFLEQDLFQTDFREASVVTLYLLQSLNVRLRPALFQQLRPGTRIVSHAFTMGEWRDDRTVETEGDENGGGVTLHFWVLPAGVAGIWRWTAPGAEQPCVLRLHQQFQEIRGAVQVGDQETPITDAKVVGDQVSFAVAREVGGQRVTMNYAGRVSGASLSGTVRVQGGPAPGEHLWNARRDPANLVGTWRWQVDGQSGALNVERQEGKLVARRVADGEGQPVPHFYAWGGGFHFTLPGTRNESYEGIVEGDRVSGTVTGGGATVRDWEALRGK